MRRMRSAGLGYGQVVMLVFGFAIASALIFLFGMWVGRDVAERRLVQEERVVRLPIPVRPTPNEEAKREVDLAFYEKLKEKAQERQETAAATTPTPAPIILVATVTPIPIAPTPTAGRKPAAAPTPTARLKHSQPAQPVREVGDEWADAGWTVQVNATTNPQQARDMAHALKAKGYDAYTVQAPTRGQTWYRVRVGRFSSRDQAKDLEDRLRTTEGLEHAYVTPR
jgi:cell division septation protein DedD